MARCDYNKAEEVEVERDIELSTYIQSDTVKGTSLKHRLTSPKELILVLLTSPSDV